MKRVVFGNEHGLARIHQIERDLEPYILAESWEELLTIPGDADIVILLLAPSAGKQWKQHRWVERLHTFRGQRPAVPLMLVVSRLPSWIEFLGKISDLRIEETAYWDETSAEVQLHISRASEHSFWNEILAECAAADLPPQMMEIITAAVNRWPPFTSVAALAHALHMERRTLNAHWQQAWSDRAEILLKDLLDWVLLAHAYRLHARPATWQFVAEVLGISSDRLRKISKRRVGATLRELQRYRLNGFESLFRVRVMTPLLDEAGSSNAS